MLKNYNKPFILRNSSLFRIYFNMEKEYILVIDSGLGGLSVLAELVKILPANYLYYADNKNCPYGAKTKEEITLVLTQIICEMSSKYHLKMVILACNTATTSAIDSLRTTFKNLIFIGTEPAIKFAEKLHYENVLALTTPTTAEQDKYKQLQLSLKNNIKTLKMKTLAMKIEQFFKNHTILNALRLKKELFFIKNHAKNHDCIVLGCTHYVLIKRLIEKYTHKPVIDGNSGIANQAQKCLQFSQSKPLDKSNVTLFCSSGNNSDKQIYKKILSQILANSQKLC